MNWKSKAVLLVVLLSPSFTGYPTNIISTHFVFGWTEQLKASGPTDGQVLYLMTVLLFMLVFSGRRVLLLGITTAALISISIVFAGGTVAFIKSKIGLFSAPTEYQYSPYYLTRYINILTVVPIAVALFMSVPFLQFEKSILSSNDGVTLRQKAFLMIVRVVNHIRYTVIPSIMSVLREEKQAGDNVVRGLDSYVEEVAQGKDSLFKKKMVTIMNTSLYVAASGIAASIEYIPFWAVEISKLPARNRKGE